MASKVIERIEQKVSDDPDAKAIVEHDPFSSSRDGKTASTSYGDLWTKSGRMAKILMRSSEMRGVEMVGVAVNEGYMLHVCQVAVLRAGKTFVPISIEEGGRRRLNAVCELCEFASVVVRDRTHKEALLEMLDASKRRWMEDRVVVADAAVVSSDARRRAPLLSSLVERKETFVSHVFFYEWFDRRP